MTITENGTHAAEDPATPTNTDAKADTADTFLDYAAREYTDLADRAPRMPMDVHIAATIGLGYEVRRLTDAIERLEKLLADPTAVLRAGLAEQAASSPAKFGLEEAEDAERVAEENGSAPRSAASG